MPDDYTVCQQFGHPFYRDSEQFNPQLCGKGLNKHCLHFSSYYGYFDCREGRLRVTVFKNKDCERRHMTDIKELGVAEEEVNSLWILSPPTSFVTKKTSLQNIESLTYSLTCFLIYLLFTYLPVCIREQVKLVMIIVGMQPTYLYWTITESIVAELCPVKLKKITPQIYLLKWTTNNVDLNFAVIIDTSRLLTILLPLPTTL